jgi:outer membrane murein-binding lipoprotein Lpp
MKTRISASLAIAGISVLMLSSCVSSKKYKASQSSLSQARSDSAQLAQQVASLNQNVQTMQQKNADLQASLDKSNSNYASEQKSLENCQAYFTRQQESATQLTQQLKDKLTTEGFADQDLQQDKNCVYISLDENNLFKPHSTVITTQGRQALTDIAGIVKSHDDMNVSVDNGLPATGYSASSDQGNMSGNMAMSSSPSGDMDATHVVKKHHYVHHTAVQNSGTVTGSNTAAGTTASTSSATATKSNTVVAHKPHHRRYSEESGSYVYTSKGMPSKQRAAWMLKSGRVNTVAKNLLQNGVTKVSVVYNNNTSVDQSHTIKVVVSPAMTEMPAKDASASTSGAGGN